MELPPEVRDDVVVASAAALSALGLTAATAGAGVQTGYLLRISPLSVYFLYLFVSKGPDGRLQRGEPWALLAAVVAAAAFVVAVR